MAIPADPATASSSGAGLVSADPDALDRFANGAGTRTRGLEPAATQVEHAVAAWNAAPCDGKYAVHLEAFGAEIAQLAQNWTMGDSFVAHVAAAFRRADTSGGSIRYAAQGAVDQGMRDTADYNPIASLSKGDQSLWSKLVGDRCYVGGGMYTGGGFIVGPDGRRYPLVIPQVGPYNADDGGPGDVNTLDGADPGWFTTAVYKSNRALFPTHDTGAIIGAAIIGLTGGKAPTGNASDPSDYNGLVLGDGRPKWYAHGVSQGTSINPYGSAGVGKLDEPKNETGFVDSPPGPSLTPAARGGLAALFPVSAVEQAASVDAAQHNGHYGAYQLRLERNVDGRVRAQLSIYQIKKNGDGSRTIAPIAVSVGQDGTVNGTIIHYRPHVEPTAPQAEPRDDGKYHILKGIKDNDGFFADPNQPYQDTYQDK